MIIKGKNSICWRKFENESIEHVTTCNWYQIIYWINYHKPYLIWITKLSFLITTKCLGFGMVLNVLWKPLSMLCGKMNSRLTVLEISTRFAVAENFWRTSLPNLRPVTSVKICQSWRISLRLCKQVNSSYYLWEVTTTV